MLHRMPAIWRMQARLPRLAALKFVVLLRRPEERAASHFQDASPNPNPNLNPNRTRTRARTLAQTLSLI